MPNPDLETTLPAIEPLPEEWHDDKNICQSCGTNAGFLYGNKYCGACNSDLNNYKER